MSNFFNGNLTKHLSKFGKVIGLDVEVTGDFPIIKIVDIESGITPDYIMYSTKYSAGFDLSSAENKIIQPSEREVINTGLKVDNTSNPKILHIRFNEKEVDIIPELQIRPRSGLAVSKGITVLNSPGTVDADYYGSIKIILLNTSNKPFEIKKGDRIAQGVISAVIRPSLIRVKEKERGEEGFGSTGK